MIRTRFEANIMMTHSVQRRSPPAAPPAPTVLTLHPFRRLFLRAGLSPEFPMVASSVTRGNGQLSPQDAPCVPFVQTAVSRARAIAESDFSMPSLIGYGLLLSFVIPPGQRDDMETSQVPVQCVRTCMGSWTPQDSGPLAITVGRMLPYFGSGSRTIAEQKSGSPGPV